MTQGLRHRPAAVRRLGIGLVLFGAAVGCQGTDKAPTSSLPPLPPPKLPASQPTTWNGNSPAPAAGTQDRATATTSTTGQKASFNRADTDPMTPTGLSPAAQAGLPVPTVPRNAAVFPRSPSTPATPTTPPSTDRSPTLPDPVGLSSYNPPTVLKDPLPPAPPPINSPTPPASSSTPAAPPALPTAPASPSVSPPNSPIVLPPPIPGGGS